MRSVGGAIICGIVGGWLLLRARENYQDQIATIQPVTAWEFRFRFPRAESPLRFWAIVSAKVAFGMFMILFAINLAFFQ